MPIEKLIMYVGIAFVVGVIVGALMASAPSIKGVTRKEFDRIWKLLCRIERCDNPVLTLWSDGCMIDSVSIGENRW